MLRGAGRAIGARTFEFLGLEPFAVAPELLRAHVGLPSSNVPPLSDGRRRSLVESYRPDVDALFARYPEFDRSLWPNFR